MSDRKGRNTRTGRNSNSKSTKSEPDANPAQEEHKVPAPELTPPPVAPSLADVDPLAEVNFTPAKTPSGQNETESKGSKRSRHKISPQLVPVETVKGNPPEPPGSTRSTTRKRSHRRISHNVSTGQNRLEAARLDWYNKIYDTLFTSELDESSARVPFQLASGE